MAYLLALAAAVVPGPRNAEALQAQVSGGGSTKVTGARADSEEIAVSTRTFTEMYGARADSVESADAEGTTFAAQGLRAVVLPFGGILSLVGQALPGGELDAVRATHEAVLLQLAAGPGDAAPASTQDPVAAPATDPAGGDVTALKPPPVTAAAGDVTSKDLLDRVTANEQLVTAGLETDLTPPQQRLDALSSSEKVEYVAALTHKRRAMCKEFTNYQVCVQKNRMAALLTIDINYLCDNMGPELWLRLHEAWLDLAGYAVFFVVALVVWTLLCKGQARRGDDSALRSMGPDALAVGNFHPVTYAACIQGMPRTVCETWCCHLCMWSETVQKLGHATFHSALVYLMVLWFLPSIVLGGCVSGGLAIWPSFYVYVAVETVLHAVFLLGLYKVRWALRGSHKQGEDRAELAKDVACIVCCFPCTIAQEAEFVEVYERTAAKPGAAAAM